MPPPTAASNSTSTPEDSAVAKISPPTLASSSLLAVTTGLPAFERVEDELAGRLDAADDLDHHVDVGIGDDRGGVVGEAVEREVDAAVLRCVAHGHPGDLEPHARAGLDAVGLLLHQLDEG